MCMRMNTPFALVTIVLATAAPIFAGCALPTPEEVRDSVEDEIFAGLECEDIARPSTLARVRAALDAPSPDTFGAIVTDPADLATVVSFAGAEVEAMLAAAHNIDMIVSSGAVDELLDGGWDGVQCGEDVDVGCVGGTGTTVVHCDLRRHEVVSIEESFDRCTIHGVVLDGAVTFSRLPKDETHAALSFTSFSIDETKVIDGEARVDIAEDGAFSAALAQQGFQFLEHGGIDSGLECGATLAINALAIDIDSTGGGIVFDGMRATSDENIAVRGDISFAKDQACACPLAGSSLFVDQLGGATVTWGDCDATVALDEDNEAVERVLSGVFTALCAAP